LQRLDTNERAEIKQLRGVVALDLDGALAEMEAVALGSRSKRHFYHASINTRADEMMTLEQWTKAVDRLEKELGLDDQPRAVVFHLKEGRAHVHVVWSRIDLESMTAISDSHNFRRHEIVARELEREFGHERVQGVHVERDGQARPDRTPSHAEIQQANRGRVSPEQATAKLTAIWQQTDSGKTFVSALEEEGWLLARGDRRDFVAIDPQGGIHSLARRIEGARAVDVRAKFQDLDPASLPTVAEAKAMAELSAKPAEIARPERELGKVASEIRLAWALTDSGAGFAAALEDRGYMLAAVTPAEAEASHRLASFAKAVGNVAHRYQDGELVVVNGFGGVYRLTEHTTGENQTEIGKYLGTVDRSTLLSVTDARDVMREASREQFSDEIARNRPATPVETILKDALAGADNGEAFALAVASAGLILTRATADDVAALRGLYDDQKLNHESRGTGAPSETLMRIGEGDFVAVNRFGGVHRINPYQVDPDKCEALQIAAAGKDFGQFGSIMEARAEILGGRDDMAAHWDAVRAERNLTPDAGGEKENESIPLTGIGFARGMDAAAGAISEALSAAADAIADIFAPPAPLTAEQIEDQRQQAGRDAAVAEQRQEARQEMTEDEARRAAIAKAQAEMEAALRQDRDDRDQDEYGYERTR
jgi:hypothetical protein